MTILRFGPLLAVAAPLAWLRGRLRGILRRPKSRRSIARSFPAWTARRPRPQVSPAARNPCAPHRRWTLPLRPPQAPRRPGVISLPPAASLRPQPRLREATRRPRSNSPTPALKARRPRLARRRRSRRPRRRPLGNRPRRLPRRRSLRLTPPCRAPRSPQAVILYKKGDAAGLMALASAATDADERSALEWTSLRADAHPSFDSLATFLEAHPSWPSRGVDSRAAGSRTGGASAGAGGRSPHFSPSEPPQSSAGKIAAARAAQAMGRA